MRFRCPLLVALLAVVFQTGCGRDSVESYRIPKEKDPEMPALAESKAPDSSAEIAAGGSGSAMANTPVATASGNALTWSAPAEWKPKPASTMRKGSYAIPGDGAGDADFAITAFPGDVGGELANLNRWRGQVDLAPVDQADFAKHVQRVEHNGLHFGVVDILGADANPQRIVGAYVAHGGATWFFKIAGPDAVVAKAKPAFLAFLQSVKPATSAAQ